MDENQGAFQEYVDKRTAAEQEGIKLARLALLDGLSPMEQYLILSDEELRGLPQASRQAPKLTAPSPESSHAPNPNEQRTGVELLHTMSTPDWQKRAFPEKLTADMAIGLFSYDDTLPGQAGETANPNAQVYAVELAAIYEKIGGERLTDLANRMTADAIARLNALGVKPSLYAASPSWALWDIAKQSYMANHPSERDPSYSRRQLNDGSSVSNIGNPIPDTSASIAKRKDIVDRHVGWEIWRSYCVNNRIGLPDASPYHSKIIEVIVNGDRNERPVILPDGSSIKSLRSYELSRIGDLAREAIKWDTTIPKGAARDKAVQTSYNVETWRANTRL